MSLIRDITKVHDLNCWIYNFIDVLNNEMFRCIAVSKSVYQSELRTSMNQNSSWIKYTSDIDRDIVYNNMNNIVIFKFLDKDNKHNLARHDYLCSAYADNIEFIEKYCNGSLRHISKAKGYDLSTNTILDLIKYVNKEGTTEGFTIV